MAAKQDCDRADTLFKQGAMAKAEYDRQKAQCTAQLFQANAARANADLAGKLAGDTRHPRSHRRASSASAT